MFKSCLIALLLSSCLGAAAAPQAQVRKTVDATDTSFRITVPDRIPMECLKGAADRYKLRSVVMLAILKIESNGRTGVVGHNKDKARSRDYGPAQLNDQSWGKYMVEKYHIPMKELTNNMCQALMAMGYALRSEMNRCIRGGFSDADAVWCSVALYHHGGALPVSGANPRIRELQNIYVRKAWAAYEKMVRTGRFE
jgi:hypothetical protein